MADATVNVTVNAGGNAAGQFGAFAKSANAATTAGENFFDMMKKKLKEQSEAPARQAAAAAEKKRQKEAAAKLKADQKEARELEQARTARITRGAGMARGFAGGGALGAIGAAGPVGAAISAGAAVFGSALDKAARTAETLNDSYATGAQKSRALFAEFVPFGDKLVRLGDAIEGVTDAIRRNEEKFTILKAQDDYTYQQRAKIGAASLEQFGYQAGYAATQKIGMAGYDKYDRTTLQGERDAQRQDMTIGARDDKTRADREAFAARATAQRAAEAAKEADKKVRAQQILAEKAQAELTANTRYENRGFRDKVGRDTTGRTVELERSRLSKEIAARETLITTAKEKAVAATQAEAQARAASVNLAKQELAYVQQQEQRMRSMAQSAGAMSQGEFLASANALKSYQDNGGNAPPEIEALVAKLAPDLVRKNQENRGGERYDQLRGLLGNSGAKAAFGDDFGKGNTLKEVMAKVDAAKADIRVTIDLDAQATAKQLADLLAPVLENLKASFKIEMGNIEKRIKATNVVRNNAAN